MSRELGSKSSPEPQKLISTNFISSCDGTKPPQQISSEELSHPEKVGKNIIVEVFADGKTTPIGCDFYKDNRCYIPQSPLPCKYDTVQDVSPHTSSTKRTAGEVRKQKLATEIQRLSAPIEIASMDNLREIAKKLREENNLSFTDLSQISGVSYASVKRFEIGRRGEESERVTEISLGVVEDVIDVYDARLDLKTKDGGEITRTNAEDTILEKLRKRREALELKQQQVAEAINISSAAYSTLENGTHDPRMTKVIEAATILESSVIMRPKTREVSEEKPTE